MRLLLLVLVMALLPVGTDARRHQRVIVVHDYTSAAWDGVVQQTVADFNAVMPKRGPLLNYERAQGECPYLAPRRTIVYCSVTYIPPHQPGGVPPAGTVFNRRTIHLLDLDPDISQWRFNHACHELMHVLTGIPDTERSATVESCVWGFLPGPGSFDVAQLRQRYGKHR